MVEQVRLLRLHEVEQIVGYKTANIYRLMSLGAFPRPVRLGSRTVRWRSDVIAAWVESHSEAAA